VPESVEHLFDGDADPDRVAEATDAPAPEVNERKRT
jgi:hypothetical protein